MNLMLYPESVKYSRTHSLDPTKFQYLEGCVRNDEPYEIPNFANSEDPLIYLSFGSLGSGDVHLLKRMLEVFSRLPYRVLANVGDYVNEYTATDIPANVHVAGWYPQPSVIPQVDAVIHHGGNNSFTECLYFGKPALIMPYVWDGHDNATRVQETGHGLKMHRASWSDDDLATALRTLITDEAMEQRLAGTSAHMHSQHGTEKAATLISNLL